MRKLALAVMLLPLPALAQKPAPATARTEAFIAALLKVKPDDGKLSAADKAANEKAFTELDGFFDYDYLTSAPISKRADKFTAEQKADFQKKFRELIRLVAYPDSGAFFKKAKYTLKPPVEKGEQVDVTIDAKVVKDDLETKVDLHWKQVKGALRIFDVSFDGDSLVKDYQAQFNKIIDKDGSKGLIERVEKKRAELDKKEK
ncbi:MAG: MlaC/ttg2D family ABC transporter substrate-binding protein [Myxococcota bacterium]